MPLFWLVTLLPFLIDAVTSLEMVLNVNAPAPARAVVAPPAPLLALATAPPIAYASIRPLEWAFTTTPPTAVVVTWALSRYAETTLSILLKANAAPPAAAVAPAFSALDSPTATPPATVTIHESASSATTFRLPALTRRVPSSLT